jgi:DNA replicative helicase MCM subunit Mcm2 (Cdc46/Mcm family)
MTPTSDERREVAARLRAYPLELAKAEHKGKDPLQLPADVMYDLIDPTCEVMEVPDNDEFMVRVVSGFVCKRCGHEAIVERNCDGSAEPPRFCPHCGARVTSGGER